MTAPKLDVSAYKRVPWSYTFAIAGFDYSDAAFALQVRQHPGDTSTPILTATLTAEFVPVFSYPDRRQQIVTTATLITATIAETALEAIALASDPEKPLELVYDLHMTPDGGVKQVVVGGAFLVWPGVTI